MQRLLICCAVGAFDLRVSRAMHLSPWAIALKMQEDTHGEPSYEGCYQEDAASVP